jgi:hypothetical protein
MSFKIRIIDYAGFRIARKPKKKGKYKLSPFDVSE